MGLNTDQTVNAVSTIPTKATQTAKVGHVVAHDSTHRLYIRKGNGNGRVVHVMDSPHLPEQKTCFTITDRGVEDIADES